MSSFYTDMFFANKFLLFFFYCFLLTRACLLSGLRSPKHFFPKDILNIQAVQLGSREWLRLTYLPFFPVDLLRLCGTDSSTRATIIVLLMCNFSVLILYPLASSIQGFVNLYSLVYRYHRCIGDLPNGEKRRKKNFQFQKPSPIVNVI